MFTIAQLQYFAADAKKRCQALPHEEDYADCMENAVFCAVYQAPPEVLDAILKRPEGESCPLPSLFTSLTTEKSVRPGFLNLDIFLDPTEYDINLAQNLMHTVFDLATKGPEAVVMLVVDTKVDTERRVA